MGVGSDDSGITGILGGVGAQPLRKRLTRAGEASARYRQVCCHWIGVRASDRHRRTLFALAHHVPQIDHILILGRGLRAQARAEPEAQPLPCGANKGPDSACTALRIMYIMLPRGLPIRTPASPVLAACCSPSSNLPTPGEPGSTAPTFSPSMQARRCRLDTPLKDGFGDAPG